MGKPIITIVQRGLADLSFLIAAIVMFVSSQKIEEHNIKVIARYLDWSGFMFCAVVNCIACFYNLVVLVIPPGSMLWRTVIVSDAIMNILVGASLGAGWQTYVLIIQGNIHANWMPICSITPYFCSKVLGSLITSTFGFATSLGLLMAALHVSVDPFLLG